MYDINPSAFKLSSDKKVQLCTEFVFDFREHIFIPSDFRGRYSITYMYKRIHFLNFLVCLASLWKQGDQIWRIFTEPLGNYFPWIVIVGTTSFRQKTFCQKTFRQTTFCQKIFCQKTFRQKVFLSKDVSSNNGSSKSHFCQKIIFVKSPVRQNSSKIKWSKSSLKIANRQDVFHYNFATT
jgi:hypothetical protein